MLEQNTIIVLTTAITVIGTLGGVVLGVVLSNRYVSRHEKERHRRETIEEFYELTLKIHRHIRDLMADEKFTTDLYERSVEYVLRMNVLVNLYLRSIKTQFTDYGDCLNALYKTHDKYFSLVGSSEENKEEKLSEAFQELKQAIDTYEQEYENLKKELEKLIK
jgi:hypothetical protein